MRANLSTLALGGSNSLYRLQMPSIPAGNLMSFCPTIATLIIKGIDFKGDRIVPPSLGSCSALNIIILTGNRLISSASTGKPNNNSIPREIGNLPVLHHLNLSSNGLLGHIPDELGDIQSDLGILDLSNNQLSGQLPASFKHLIKLQMLNLHQNKLSGGIEVWSLSRMLSVIDLSHNLLSGFVNASAADQHEFNGIPGKLQILSLSFNKLRGGIPEWMWELPDLGMLDLSNNILSGGLPNEMSKLTCMMSEDCAFGFGFDDDVGNFEDYIPIDWKSQEVPMSQSVRENRIMLDISNNKLEGKIPSSFGNLVAVKSLNLSHNKFTGGIPPQLGNLSALEALDISANELTGGIPVELAYLDALSSINVSYNRLEGPIPTQHNFDTRHALDASCFVGNLGLCGAPLPNACPTNHTPVPAINQQKEDITAGQDLLTRISDHVALGGVLLGFVLGFLGVFCFILFSWRAASFKIHSFYINIITMYRASHS